MRGPVKDALEFVKGGNVTVIQQRRQDTHGGEDDEIGRTSDSLKQLLIPNEIGCKHRGRLVGQHLTSCVSSEGGSCRWRRASCRPKLTGLRLMALLFLIVVCTASDRTLDDIWRTREPINNNMSHEFPKFFVLRSCESLPAALNFFLLAVFLIAL